MGTCLRCNGKNDKPFTDVARVECSIRKIGSMGFWVGHRANAEKSDITELPDGRVGTSRSCNYARI